jgi:hypothetical protein
MIHPPGWTCQRTRQQFESYLLSALVLQEALALAEHLEACPDCGQQLVVFRLSLTAAGPRG